MHRSLLILAAALAAVTATSADARTCRRLNKTEGAVVGAAGGAILGHEIARTRYNRNCRYYRRSRR